MGNIKSGNIYALYYVMFVALSDLFINIIGKKYSIIFMLLGISSVSIIYSTFIVKNRIIKVLKQVVQYKLLWFGMLTGIAEPFSSFV